MESSGAELAGVEFQVLGPLRVIARGGVEVRLASVAQRRLLSLFLQSPGGVVSAQHLDRHLDLSAGALRTSVSRLRQIVGFETLVTAAPGYALHSDSIDAHRFERLLQTARCDHDPASARAALEEALALWRGLAYAEFADEAWAVVEVSRLEGLRADAVVRLVELLLAADEWGDAVGHLEPLIDRHPFDDRLRALLMRALAESGRRVDALRAFQGYRTFLLDEVGMAPAPAIVDLDRAIAAADGPNRTVTPVRLPPSLPAPLTSFVGRAEERRIVADLVAGHRLVTLTGAGGCGKSRLALETARTLVERGDRGAWWIDLAAVATPGQVAETMARAVGCVPTASRGADVVGQLTDQLLGLGPTALVVDNAEHVLDAAGDVVRDVLVRCPDVRVLATSREALGLAGEQIWRVPSLSLPDLGVALSVADLDRFDATTLFLERSRLARPDLEFDQSSVAAVLAICSRLDGLPLALELAAARLGSLPLDRIAAGIDDAFGLLGAGPRGTVARHETLQASIRWSLDLLDDPDRTALGRLSVFHGSFTIGSAMDVLGELDGAGQLTGAAVLGRLVERSLVQLDVASGRYRLLETIRQFCRAHLVSGAELDLAQRRHGEHYTRWCADVGAGRHGIARGPIVREMPNVVAAMAWAREHDPRAALHMCQGLASVRSTLGHPDDVLATWDWLVGFDRDGPDAASWAAAMAGSMAAATAHGFEMDGWVEQIEPRLEPDDQRARGWLVRGAAMVPAYQGHVRAILAYASGIAEQSDEIELSVYGGFAAYMAALVGLVPEAEAMVDVLHGLALRHEVPFAVETVGNGFAAAVVCLLHRGRLRDLQSLIAATGPSTDAAFSITAAAAMARAATMADDPALLAEAVAWAQLPTIPMLGFLGLLVDHCHDLADGRWEDAVHAANRFHRESILVPILRAGQQSLLNVALLETGRTAAAAASTEAAAALVEAMGEAPMMLAAVAQARAQVAWCDGRATDAVREASTQLDLATAHGFPLLVVDALELLAVAASARRADDLAAALLAATLAERDRLGYRFVMHAPRAERDTLAATIDRDAKPMDIEAAITLARADGIPSAAEGPIPAVTSSR